MSSVANSFRALIRTLLDALFPISCLGCGEEGTYLCDACFERIPERDFQECPVCRAPYSPNGSVCQKCRNKTSLDGLLIAAPYQFPLVEKLVHALKYRFLEEVRFPLARLLVRTITRSTLPLPDFVVPVPLHPRRLRFRGFNQADLLAQTMLVGLTPGLEIPIAGDLLQRVRFTKPQMKTESREERIANVAEAFRLNVPTVRDVDGKSIWIIDDVATTGTTLDECAKVLKQSGVKSVWGIVIAR